MKIAIVSNYRPGNETGVAQVSETLSKALSSKHEVLYVCLGENYQLIKKGKNLKYLQIPSVPIKHGFVPRLSTKTVEKINSDLNDFSPNIIHSQNIVFAALICLVWARKNNIPFITTFHYLPSENLITWVYPKLAEKKIVKLISKSLKPKQAKNFIKFVDLVIALNVYVEKSLNEINGSTKVVRLNNGLDLVSFENLKITRPSKIINFTYLGSYISKKNQEFLIKAFKHLPDNYVLHLYGNKKTNKDYVNKLNKIISTSNIKNVHIHDYVKHQDVPKVLEKSHYFVSASLKEVQSLVVIEALASGKPVIALENETVSELIDGRNGIKLPKNTSPKRFLLKLKSYVFRTNPVYLYTSDHCRNSVVGFDINKVAVSLIKIYKNEIKIKSRDIKNPNGKLINQLPKQLRELLAPILPKSEGKNIKLRYMLILTVATSILLWPIVKLWRFSKSAVKKS